MKFKWFKWWAIRLTEEGYTYGLESSMFKVPELYPSREKARKAICKWKKEDGNIVRFKPKPKKVYIYVKEK